MFEIYGYVISQVDMFSKGFNWYFSKICFSGISLLAADMAKFQAIKPY